MSSEFILVSTNRHAVGHGLSLFEIVDNINTKYSYSRTCA
jgi:hypothetical protein